MSGGVTGSGSAQPPEQPPGARAIPHCYRHPDRETYISCQRCGRPICPECMQQASVGFQCPQCVAEGRSSTPRPRTVYGGRVRAGDNVATLTLIGINVVAYVAILATGGAASSLANETVLFPIAVANGEWWRLLTATFVHIQFLHLFFNMFALWIFGPVLENMLGRTRFVTLYLLSGLVGSVAVYWLSAPNIPTLGASGSIFGLLGAALVVSVRRGYDVTWLLGLLAINLVFTFVATSISWQGHLGGLAGGLAIGAAIAWAPRKFRTVVQVLVFGVIFALCLLLIALRTAELAPF